MFKDPITWSMLRVRCKHLIHLESQDYQFDKQSNAHVSINFHQSITWKRTKHLNQSTIELNGSGVCYWPPITVVLVGLRSENCSIWWCQGLLLTAHNSSTGRTLQWKLPWHNINGQMPKDVRKICLLAYPFCMLWSTGVDFFDNRWSRMQPSLFSVCLLSFLCCISPL